MKLKACPFCGEGYTVITGDVFGSLFVRCDNCMTSGPQVKIGRMKMDIANKAAALAWNKRTAGRGMQRGDGK